MAVTVENVEDDQQEMVVEDDAVEAQDESQDVVAEESQQQQDQQEAESDEVVVTIGEEAPPAEDHAPAPAWVKELRKANREKDRRIRELESKLQTSVEHKPTLPKKPTIEDFDYDTERYESALADWFEQKRKVDELEVKARQQQEHAQQQWQQKLQSYADKRVSLKVPDYEDAEGVVMEVMSPAQQSIILDGADNPALIVYALGKNEAKAREIAAIANPVQFAFAVAKLEAQVKMTNKTKAPPPEKRLSGTGRVAGSLEDRLEAARAKAEKTGDMTEVMRIKREMRNKS